jgi:alpha-beta hydrolase superfamily lysophospholipase
MIGALAMVLAACATPRAPVAAVPREIAAADGTPLSVAVFPAARGPVVLWLPGETGVMPAETRLAGELAARGVEVWLPDLFSSRFLSALPSSLAQVPASDIELLTRAASAGGRPVVLMTNGRGAALVARGLAAGAPARGAILLHPNFYQETPAPGQEAVYMKELAALRLPVVIVQPDRSPYYWYREALETRLVASGATVTWRLLPGVRDRFYFRPDMTAEEEALGRRLPAMVIEALNRIERRP